MIVLAINSEVDFWQFNVSTTTHPTTYTHTHSHTKACSMLISTFNLVGFSEQTSDILKSLADKRSYMCMLPFQSAYKSTSYKSALCLKFDSRASAKNPKREVRRRKANNVGRVSVEFLC